MASTRAEVVKIAQSYVGCKQGSKKHRFLVDTFNFVKPHGEVANYTCAWCSLTWTAIQILAGNSQKVVPYSYNCGRLIEYAKKLGIWQEKDSYKPSKADGIIYNWDDTGKGDCKKGADHVGIVEKVKSGKIYVIEGNKGTTKACGRRTIVVNARFIRGFICPKYKTTSVVTTTVENKAVSSATTETVKVTNAEQLVKTAKALCWPYGTAKEKWSYKTGRPTTSCKAIMTKYGYDKKIQQSDCGHFAKSMARYALGHYVDFLDGTNDPFPKAKGFTVIKEGTLIKRTDLKPGDFVRYKRKDSKGKTHQHVGMYFGKVRKNNKTIYLFAEAGRGDRYPVIHATDKFFSTKTKIQILRVEEK